jgi:hypothetical protein
MPIKRPVIPVIGLTEADSAPVPGSDSEGGQLRNSIEPEPLGWDAAVHASGVLLEEMFGPPGSVDNPIMRDMARELAARLCAYDEIAEVVEDVQARALTPRPVDLWAEGERTRTRR